MREDAERKADSDFFYVEKIFLRRSVSEEEEEEERSLRKSSTAVRREEEFFNHCKERPREARAYPVGSSLIIAKNDLKRHARTLSGDATGGREESV